MQTAHDHDKALCNDLRSEELARLSLVRELGIREDTLLAATSKADATTTRINLLEKMLDDAAIEKRIAVQVFSNCARSHSCAYGCACCNSVIHLVVPITVLEKATSIDNYWSTTGILVPLQRSTQHKFV